MVCGLCTNLRPYLKPTLFDQCSVSDSWLKRGNVELLLNLTPQKKFGNFVHSFISGNVLNSVKQNVMSLESPCIDLSNNITFIAIVSFFAKRPPSEYGWVKNRM